VVSDTTRRDRMGIHGGPAHTPHFDRFAEENLWFPQAVSQAPWTKPSVATLFTSLYPTQHGVVTHPSHQLRAGEELGRRLVSSDRLADSAVTLAEAYRAAGFRTAAFVANPWMDRRFGFEQGFEHYDDSFARWEVPGAAVVESALAWLETLGADERFFLYVHTIDAHRPYPALTFEEALAAATQPPAPGDIPLIPIAARREIRGQIRIEGPRPAGARCRQSGPSCAAPTTRGSSASTPRSAISWPASRAIRATIAPRFWSRPTMGRPSTGAATATTASACTRTISRSRSRPGYRGQGAGGSTAASG